MNATRAGKGCGSCKGLVKEIVEAALGGEGAADPADSYYVPASPCRVAQVRCSCNWVPLGRRVVQ